jgi:hypothetical protein
VADPFQDKSDQQNIIICQVCGYQNLVGTLVCKNCGAVLVSMEARTRGGTRNLNEELPEFQTNPVFTPSTEGVFTEGMHLKLEVVEQNTKINIMPTARRQIVIGRRDPVSKRRPEIDMEDFAGYRLGVSRKHALIALKDDELTLQDYGSANGTYLNGVRLPAHQAHKLHDGDVIQLGQLSVRVYFEK